MTPATFAGVQQPQARRGRKALWDRDTIIQAIQEWVTLHGEPPRAADWNPSSAKWSGQEWRIARYRAGRPDGTPWPALNAAKRPFGGSLVAAIRAAGFEPAKPGPKRRTNVDLAQCDPNRLVISPEGRAMLEAALAQARDAGRRAATLEARLERAMLRARTLIDERDAARRDARRVPKVVRERVADDAALRRARTAADKAQVRVAQLRDELATARMDVAEARTAAGRLAARLERAEATVADLRSHRRDLRAQLEDAHAECAGLDELLTEARAAAAATVARVVHEPAPEADALRDAIAEAAVARRAATAADERAARADRALRETVAAVKGEPRHLSSQELAELRADGPAGPAVLAAALQDLALARKRGGEQRLAAALRRVAEAAVTWQERI